MYCCTCSQHCCRMAMSAAGGKKIAYSYCLHSSSRLECDSRHHTKDNNALWVGCTTIRLLFEPMLVLMG